MGIRTVSRREKSRVGAVAQSRYCPGLSLSASGQGGPGMAHDLIQRVASLGKPRILVVGDLILDRYVWGYAERISQEAPVPLLRADQREHRLGGAASVATMLRALEAEVAL